MPACLQVRLVLEFCDRGNLRDAADHGAFFGCEWPPAAWLNSGMGCVLWLVQLAWLG
jgi:hypothetical protein